MVKARSSSLMWIRWYVSFSTVGCDRQYWLIHFAVRNVVK